MPSPEIHDTVDRWGGRLDSEPAGTLLWAPCGCSIVKRTDGRVRLHHECDAHAYLSRFQASLVAAGTVAYEFVSEIDNDPSRVRRWWKRWLCTWIAHRTDDYAPVRVIGGLAERRCYRCGAWTNTEASPPWSADW